MIASGADLFWALVPLRESLLGEERKGRVQPTLSLLVLIKALVIGGECLSTQRCSSASLWLTVGLIKGILLKSFKGDQLYVKITLL